MGYAEIKDTGGKSPPSKEKKGDVYFEFQWLGKFLSPSTGGRDSKFDAEF